MCEDGRDFKTNREHWEIIVNYFEEYPQLVKCKFQKMDGDSREIRNMWQKLVEHLNSLGYGQKTVDKWQLAIGRWKSKVKAKATMVRLEMEKTGGGPAKSPPPPLADLEERLMSLIGWKAVTGDGNKEFGIKSLQKTTIPTEKNKEGVLEEMCLNDQDTIYCTLEASTKASTSSAVQPPPLHFLNCNKTLPSSDNKVKKGIKRKIPQSTERSRKMVSLSQIHSENLVVLKNIENNTKNLADSIMGIRNDFKEYINFLKEN